MAEGVGASTTLQGEGSEFKCPLCPRAYQRSRGLVAHLVDKHRDNPGYARAMESIPKSPPRTRKCCFCGLVWKKVNEHQRTCKDNPNSARAQKANVEQQWFDPDLRARAREVFPQSELVFETMARFAGGDFTSPRLQIAKMPDAQAFLALYILLRNSDAGMEDVTTLTLSDLQGALPAPDGGCYRVGKVQVSHFELVVLKDFTFKKGRTNHPAYQPFAGATREGMIAILKRASPDLCASALRTRSVGSKELQKEEEKEAAVKVGGTKRGLVGSGRAGTCPGCFLTPAIVDDESFRLQFGDYLRLDPVKKQQYVDLIAEFSEWQKTKLPDGYSLWRLGRLFELKDLDDVPLLPPDTWIRSLDSEEGEQKFAVDAYKKLVGFLLHLIGSHRGWHITREASEEMQEYILDMEFRAEQALRQASSIRLHRRSKALELCTPKNRE